MNENQIRYLEITKKFYSKIKGIAHQAGAGAGRRGLPRLDDIGINGFFRLLWGAGLTKGELPMAREAYDEGHGKVTH